MRRAWIATTLGCCVASMVASGQSGPWTSAEAPLLSGHTQLTFHDQFVKAGEAYFNPEMTWIIFQAIARPEDEQAEPDEHYSMYAAPLVFENERVVGLGEVLLLSPHGSANTCGWFHPTEQGVVMFGSTLVPPSADLVPGYQRDTSKYSWAFPSEMEIVSSRIGSQLQIKPIFEQPGYTAEGSWSSDGRYILYANVNDERSTRLGRPDADLWIYDHTTKERTLIVEADGYDGGPFFSPDDKWICYRSDRRGDNQLQLFASELAFDEDGRPTGIVREIALTDNEDVNWAPYWHPSGKFWIYTSSAYSHLNYEVLAIEFAPDKPLEELKTFRVTDASGFDGLSVFSPDGRHMMWTSQRGQGASSQLWIARFHEEVARGQLLEAMPVISPVEMENGQPAVEADGS